MAKILHKIKAWLYRNLLTQDNPDDFIARVISERSLNVGEICESAVTRGGADISADAMEHAVNLFHKEMGYRMCDGFSVNTGWYTGGLRIHGGFNSPIETYNSEKHTLSFEFHQGALLRKELETVTVEILGVAESGMLIAQVTDVRTDTVNDLLTPNRNLKIVGDKIRIAGDSDVNGVFFTNQETRERIKTDVSDIVVNNPSSLIIVIPRLAQGTYLLEVTTQYSGNSQRPLKEPRTAVFDRPLTVR
jgi:hypothetical protein